MRWLMGLFGRLRRRDPPPPQPIDRAALRFEMSQTDPDFARIRDVHHDALQALAARRAADGLALRREREFWAKHGEQHRP